MSINVSQENSSPNPQHRTGKGQERISTGWSPGARWMALRSVPRRRQTPTPRAPAPLMVCRGCSPRRPREKAPLSEACKEKQALSNCFKCQIFNLQNMAQNCLPGNRPFSATGQHGSLLPLSQTGAVPSELTCACVARSPTVRL